MHPFRPLAPLALMLLGLTGCVETSPADEGLAYLQIENGGAFSGSTTTRIYADDRLETLSTGPFGEKPQRKVSQGRAGVYDDLMALYLAEGPRLAARLDRKGEDICEDYGADSVRAEPPAGGFDNVVAFCPSNEVLDFQRRLLEMIPGR